MKEEGEIWVTMGKRSRIWKAFHTASVWHQEGYSSNSKVLWLTSYTCLRALSHPFNKSGHFKIDHNIFYFQSLILCI